MPFTWVIFFLCLHVFSSCGSSVHPSSMSRNRSTIAIRFAGVPIPGWLTSKQKETFACEKLKNQLGIQWEKNFFGNCRLRDIVLYGNIPSYLNMTVAVNTEPLSWYDGVQSDVATAWNINVLLNSQESVCKTAVTFGKERDFAPLPRRVNGSVTLTYILVAEGDRSLCWKIKRRKIYASRIHIKKCAILDYVGPAFDRKTLVKFMVEIEFESENDMPPFKPDFQLPFLHGLSEHFGGCKFNGYIPDLKPVDAVTVRYLVTLDATPLYSGGINVCRRMRRNLGPLWREGKIGMCIYERIESDFRSEFNVKTTMLFDKYFLEEETGNTSEDVRAWKLNVLLNSENSVCKTAVQFEEKNVASPGPPWAFQLWRQTYVLIAEDSTTLCSMMSRRWFAGSRILILGCKKSEELGKVRGGGLLAKYTLDIWGQTFAEGQYQKVDTQLLFLKELSRYYGSCKFNGYWSKWERA